MSAPNRVGPTVETPPGAAEPARRPISTSANAPRAPETAPGAAPRVRAFDGVRPVPQRLGVACVRRAAALLAICLLTASPCLAAVTKPRTFQSPEQAMQALVDAARAHDASALLAILGSGARPLVTSGDDVA